MNIESMLIKSKLLELTVKYPGTTVSLDRTINEVLLIHCIQANIAAIVNDIKDTLAGMVIAECEITYFGTISTISIRIKN